MIEFLPKYIKPVEDLVTYLSEDFKNNSNPKVRQLLGLNYEYPKIMDASKKTNNIGLGLSLIHISEPTRRRGISYAVFCLKKKKNE